MIRITVDSDKSAEGAKQPKIELITVIKQTWTESERGWGCRPDGYSLHLSEEDMHVFNKDYWANQPPGPAPDEYSRPDENPTPTKVAVSVFGEVKSSKNGIRKW